MVVILDYAMQSVSQVCTNIHSRSFLNLFVARRRNEIICCYILLLHKSMSKCDCEIVFLENFMNFKRKLKKKKLKLRHDSSCRGRREIPFT